jgi:FkbM family methyltransferase
MRIDTTLYWQRLMLAEAFERRSAWLVAQLLEKGDVFVDGGANCGFYSCLAAGRVGPSGQVIACEPDQRLHAQLALQARLNAPVIEVRHDALSDEMGPAEFHLPPGDIPDGWGLGIASLEPHDGWVTHLVKTVTLDVIAGGVGRSIALAKLDLEGHEAQALRGAQEVLRTGKLESLLIEVNDTRMFEELRAHQFDIILDVRNGFADVPDLRALDGTHTDLAFLRGQCARRWQRVRPRTRWM